MAGTSAGAKKGWANRKRSGVGSSAGSFGSAASKASTVNATLRVRQGKIAAASKGAAYRNSVGKSSSGGIAGRIGRMYKHDILRATAQLKKVKSTPTSIKGKYIARNLDKKRLESRVGGLLMKKWKG